MQRVKFVAYRFLTANDFFNLYKPAGTQAGGGGQLYIDFPTSRITPARWRQFFDRVLGVQTRSVTHGLRWDVPVKSIGTQPVKVAHLELYQRRPQTICIANQNLYTRQSNRIPAWHPSSGFPQPRDATHLSVVPLGLAIYLVRTYEGDVWAGWFQSGRAQSEPANDDESRQLLREMLGGAVRGEGTTGFITLTDGTLFLDEANARSPFTSVYKRGVAAAEEPDDRNFDEDEVDLSPAPPETREAWKKVRIRNRAAVTHLKRLYNHRCQLTGEKFVFVKKNGEGYTEAHHLIALGLGGADEPHNIIVVSAHIHRMLHFAKVPPIDLSKIRYDSHGWGALDIKINGDLYPIRWHPQHAKTVSDAGGKSKNGRGR